MCLWFYAENAIKQRPQMRSIAQPMQPLTSGLFVHISASKQAVISDRIFCLSLLLLWSFRSFAFIYSVAEPGKSLPWIVHIEMVDSLLCNDSWRMSTFGEKQRQRITHWKTNDASTTSVNRVTYLLFDEFVLHVVCMSIHFVIKGCVSRHAFCSSSMNQYRTKSSETIAIVNPKCWPHF